MSDMYRVEELIRDQLGPELLELVMDHGSYSAGCLPSVDECMSLVNDYGEDMWSILSEIDGDNAVARRIMNNGVSAIESWGEFIVSFVASVYDEVAYHWAVETNLRG